MSPAEPGTLNLRRMVTVWAILAAVMTLVALACWARMPREEPAAAGGVPTDTAAINALVWPKGVVGGRPWRYIVIHHSATPSGTLASIAQGHRDRGFQEAGYHFLINNGRAPGTMDGEITPTPRWLDQLAGAHTNVREHPEFNTEGIGICLIGDLERQAPTPAQMASLEILVKALHDRCGIPLERIVGHGEVKNTQCPGKLFPMELFLMELRSTHLLQLSDRILRS